MKVNKIISTGIGEITNPSPNELRYILNNHVLNSSNKLERTVPADVLELMAEENSNKLERSILADSMELMEKENGRQRSYSILKTAQDMYNSVMNLL
mgnify:FL=1